MLSDDLAHARLRLVGCPGVVVQPGDVEAGLIGGIEMPIVEELRVVADIGVDPGSRVELWIIEEFDQGCACVSLAAVIGTDY